MSESLNEVVDQLKDLSDLEFEILFVDDICKKLKLIDKPGVRSESLLIMYLSIIDTLKKFKLLATEGGRSIPHEEAIDMIISKSEAFLSSVADNESKAMYTFQSLSAAHSFVKELLWQLKKELAETPEYSYLKREWGTDYASKDSACDDWVITSCVIFSSYSSAFYK